ncbi:hypothetical protein BDW62DRAFT_187233 [Aspergillus aurantiobrunneus]
MTKASRHLSSTRLTCCTSWGGLPKSLPITTTAGLHTDVSPQNVLMAIYSKGNLGDIQDQEAMDPSIPINTGNPTLIYKSRPTLLELSGHPILSDFGQMRLLEGHVNQDWWMSDLYRAPEVLLQLPWGFAVDNWSIAVMVSAANSLRINACLQHQGVPLTFQSGHLNLWKARTYPVDRVHGQYVLPLPLAQYIGYLGPPPL